MRVFQVKKVPKIREVDQDRVNTFLQNSTTPVDFELGSGVGMFAIRYARDNPVRRLLSVEKTREKFSAFESRLKNHPEVSNLLPLHANAVSVLCHHLVPESLSKFFLWYPNPYPEKSRFHRTPFFEFMLSRIVCGGKFYFASNVQSYTREMEQFFCRQSHFHTEGAKKISKVLNPEFQPRTHFEMKYYARGEILYQIIAQKNCISS